MNTQVQESPISPTVQAVLDLFSAELCAVRFPDLDAEVLREAAERVREQAEEQARSEARLQAAREARQEAEDALLHKCQRALAYARVYAEDDPELGRKLEALSLPRGRGERLGARGGVAPVESEPRGAGRRSRRSATPSGGLFLEAGAETPLCAEDAAP